MTTELRVEWKWGALAALAMSLIALYPQISLWIARGDQWQGSYSMTQGDEVMYSAYVNALIDERPRKNDPFNGRDFVPGQAPYETLNSIQFVPAYLVALPARAFGLNASTAFIWLLVISAIISTLAIFWLIATLTGDSKSAAVGALLTLCFGALVGSDCCWRANAFSEMVPFLRRYQPAATFPLFFVFCVFVWLAVTRANSRARSIYSLAAGTTLSVMVFSYFYIWTAAAAWFACVALLWVAFRRVELRRIAFTISIVGALAAAATAAFLMMFLNRNPTIDQGQLLVSTHAPDLFNQPEILGFIVMGALAQAAWRKQVDIRSPTVLFALSFTLTPFVVFNQQILTGMSLQPIHYKVFIANYVALISVVLAFLILWRARYAERQINSLMLVVAAVVALGWGAVEVFRATERWAQKEILRDNLFAVAKQLTSIANEDGSLKPALAGKAAFPTVFTFAVDETLEVSMSIPTYSPMAVLYSLHSDAFISPAESKARYYRHLYYSGLTPEMVEARMIENAFWVVVPLFGSERVVPGLVHDFKPITLDDIQEERRRYAEFYDNFTIEQAADPRLNFVVVPDGSSVPNFDNLDTWYERHIGQKVGAFTIYRIRLRPSTASKAVS
jgi:hypothetical protein